MEKLTKGLRTKQSIIKASLKLFSKLGFDQTSVQMIADECELSQASVFQHFKSKKNLLQAVRQHVSVSNHQFVDAKISLENNAFENLRAHCIGNLEWALKYRPEAQVIVLTYYYGSVDKDFSAASKNAIEMGQERIYRYVVAGQRERLFHFEGSAKDVARALHDALLGLFVKLLALQRGTDLPDSDRHHFERIMRELTKYQSHDS